MSLSVRGPAASSKQEVLDRLLAGRERHRARSLPLRVAQAGGAFLLGVVSLPLLVLLPELGVPLLLVALRLLADEFDWAARAYATVAWSWQRFRTWLAARSRVTQALVLLATLAVAAGLVLLLLQH